MAKVYIVYTKDEQGRNIVEKVFSKEASYWKYKIKKFKKYLKKSYLENPSNEYLKSMMEYDDKKLLEVLKIGKQMENAYPYVFTIEK